LLFVLFAIPVLAEEPRVYTEQDLEKYTAHSSYDQETIIRSADEMKRWEADKAREELLLKTQDEAERKEQVRKQLGTVTQRTSDTPDDKTAHKTKKKRHES
jgi:ABC-type transport system involved in cytochrome bd biosynthesis fused ATPase/permease subunit